MKTDDPEKIREWVEEQVGNLSVSIAKDIHSNLTADPREGGTPVRSGFASASWICSIGTPSTQVGGSPGNPDKGPSLSGLSSLSTYHIRNGVIFIVNNTEYILDLNDGSSDQALRGFIDSSVIRGAMLNT